MTARISVRDGNSNGRRGRSAARGGARFAGLADGIRSGLHCPHCDSIVYSRKSKLCGVCSRELPENLRFTGDEAESVNRLMAIEKARHRRWITKKFLDAVSVL